MRTKLILWPACVLVTFALATNSPARAAWFLAAIQPVFQWATGYLLGKAVDPLWDKVTGKPDVRALERRIQAVEEQLDRFDEKSARIVGQLRSQITPNLSRSEYNRLARHTFSQLEVRIAKLEKEVAELKHQVYQHDNQLRAHSQGFKALDTRVVRIESFLGLNPTPLNFPQQDNTTSLRRPEQHFTSFGSTTQILTSPLRLVDKKPTLVYQPLPSNFVEYATYKFKFSNPNPQIAHVTRATLHVTGTPQLTEQAAQNGIPREVPLPEPYVLTWIDGVQQQRTISFPVNLIVLPNSTVDIVLRFRSADQPDFSMLRLKGRVTFEYQGPTTTESTDDFALWLYGWPSSN